MVGSDEHELVCHMRRTGEGGAVGAEGIWSVGDMGGVDWAGQMGRDRGEQSDTNRCEVTWLVDEGRDGVG